MPSRGRLTRLSDWKRPVDSRPRFSPLGFTFRFPISFVGLFIGELFFFYSFFFYSFFSFLSFYLVNEWLLVSRIRNLLSVRMRIFRLVSR